MECSICKKEINGYGNNPYPVRKSESRCCRLCNDKYVIPARLAMMNRSVNDVNNLVDVLDGMGTDALDNVFGYR